MIKANFYSSISDVFTELSERKNFSLPDRYGSNCSDDKYIEGKQATNAVSHAWASAFEISAIQGNIDIFEKQLQKCTYLCPWPLVLFERVDLNKFLRKSYDYEWKQYFNTFFRLVRLHSSKELVLKFSSESSLLDENDKLEEESESQREMGYAIVHNLIYQTFVQNKMDGDSLNLHAKICGVFIKEYLQNLLPDDSKNFKNVATKTIQNLEKIDNERTEIIRKLLLPVSDLIKST